MLFKSIDTAKTPANCIDEDAVKRHVSSFQKNIDWDTMQPIIDTAEEKHVLPVIGSELYDLINADYAAYPTTALPAKRGVFIRKLQKAVAYFAHHVAIQELITSTGDLGPVETQDSNNTATIPRQWTIKTALRHSFITAHEKLNLALDYLEANADDAEFTAWKGSKAFSESHKYFIRGANDLAEWMPTDMPRVVWLQLRPYMAQAEQRYIKPVLGADFFNEMKAAVAANNLSAVQLECLTQIQSALISWVKMHAIPHLRLVFTENGLLELQGDTDGVLTFQRPVRPDATGSLWISLNDAGKYFLVSLKAWLVENSADFPTFEASDAYDPGTPHNGFITTGDDDETHSTYAFG
jgi:hypothetical protein